MTPLTREAISIRRRSPLRVPDLSRATITSSPGIRLPHLVRHNSCIQRVERPHRRPVLHNTCNSHGSKQPGTMLPGGGRHGSRAANDSADGGYRDISSCSRVYDWCFAVVGGCLLEGDGVAAEEG